MPDSRVALPSWLLPILGLGALLALGGGLWDDAWHTERGRDTFFIAPHLAIYGGISLVGAGISLWLLRAARVVGVRSALRSPVILLATSSVALTLASAPIDNAWHLAFGRDAVIWSPPHTLGIIGTGALAVAVLVELARSDTTWARRAQGPTGGLLLAAFAFLVVEYETDVPQFADVWYLPALALGAGFALAVIDRLGGRRRATTTAAGWHLVFVLCVSGFLVLQGFDPPRLPLLVVPALVLDLSRSWPSLRRAAAAAVATLAVYVPMGYVGRGVQLDAGEIVLAAPLVWAAFALWLLALGERPAGRPPIPALPVALVLLLALLPGSAPAHDPGQGPEAGTIDLTVATRDDVATVSARAAPELEPLAIVARRGGVTREAPLTAVGPGESRGAVRLPDPGRWFVYVELRDPAGRDMEAWLPVTRDGSEPVHDPQRFLYEVQSRDSSVVKWLAGVLLYAMVAAFLAAVVVLVRRVAPAPGAAGTPYGSS